MTMNLYEQAVCYFACAHPVIAIIDGWYIPVPRGENRRWLPFMLEFYKVFQQLKRNGMVEQSEFWPYPIYTASNACLRSALEIYKKHGYKATYLVPGMVGLEAWK